MKWSGPVLFSTRRGWGVGAAALLLGALGWVAPVAAQSPAIVVASTTSTEQSGLFGHILPEFSQASGIAVKVVAQGTGQAIDMARRGDADVLFVHDKAAEEKFVADGFAPRRFDVMYNDFVLVGPKADPAQLRGKDIVAALRKAAAAQAPFVSRGDKSGTHAAELRFWQQAGADKGSGYKECGCGMGPALNMAAATGSYLLADRGTWLSFKNKADLAVLVEGDPRLFNPYGVMRVSATKHPHVKSAEAQQFVDWVLSPAGQAAIASYKINGEQLFFPSAAR
ncbi:MAG: extracellular solute-binding protein [Burkholderiales bacterium]|nr:extracellular solute-binding protein [Burkholderiales bacterium]